MTTLIGVFQFYIQCHFQRAKQVPGIYKLLLTEHMTALQLAVMLLA